MIIFYIFKIKHKFRLLFEQPSYIQTYGYMYIHVPADFLRRRSVQSALIAVGMSNWLVGALENHEELTDFTLEYSVALLMNLCLRSKGNLHYIMYSIQ